jgi:hypothetical protein
MITLVSVGLDPRAVPVIWCKRADVCILSENRLLSILGDYGGLMDF